MNPSSFKKLSRAKKLSVLLLGTTLAWAIGLPALMSTASAASVTFVSDTLVSSAPSVSTNHLIEWTSVTTVTAGQTMTIQFTPGNSGGATDEFRLDSLATATDVVITGANVTQVADAAGCTVPTTKEVYVSNINNIAGFRIITFTVCPTDTIAAGAISLNLNNSHVINPSTAPQSYVVRIGGTQTDGGDTRVAIIATITMSAKVDTTLTFTITGLATTTAILGTTTDINTTATQIAWNTLTPGVSKTAAQDLNVTTNATHGFEVTIVQSQNLLSSTGADIDRFIDGAGTAVPVLWVSPANTLGNENTFGHYGITSNDSDEGGGEFQAAGPVPKWAGNIDTPRLIFSHTAPADGLAQDIGKARIGFRIEIGSLQEAANDYTNVLTYVCTPTF